MNSTKNKIFKSADIAARIVTPGEKVFLFNLGCVRNTADSQMILGQLQAKGHELVNLNQADTVIINTCAFIEDAKKESVDAILEVLDLKKAGKVKKVIVAGCLSERYAPELAAELKAVDAFVGVAALAQNSVVPQVLLTPRHFAYVKICESCYNQCSFCVIPQIKGKFMSRRKEVILAEVKGLDVQSVKEVNLIGQDITAYGMDLYQDKALAKLVQDILKNTRKIAWIRLLYAFPAHITEELLRVIAQEPRVCKYLDLPLQHISDSVLKTMKRRFSSRQTKDLLTRIRKTIPGVAIRTAFIVGFPGETDKDFQELLRFVEDMRFEKLGVFQYSREEGTAAYRFPRQVPAPVKQERYEQLMALQQQISRESLAQFLGQTVKVLIDEKSKSGDNVYLGRTEHDAPEVDGIVQVHSQKPLRPGDFVQVRINATQDYDLVGKAL